MKKLPLLKGWNVRTVGDESWRPAQIPGCTHLDLLAAGAIPDPFQRDHEQAVRWVGEKDWEYRLVFTAPRDIRHARHARLVFEGLDTYATVRLNGEVILEADNMFRPWSADVTGRLRSRGNELTIVFRSPVSSILPGLAHAPYRLPCPNDQTGGSCPYTRKAQYQFGWDWGPCLVTAGIWQPVRLEAWDDARLADVDIRTTSLTAALAEVEVAVELEGVAAPGTTLHLLVAGAEVAAVGQEQIASSARATLAARIEQPRWWWPAGHGEQALYEVEVRLCRGEVVLDSIQRRVGLRTIEVRRTPDAAGASFEFVVNGRPIFAKGANWIPADSFPTRVSPGQYRHLLESARAAHFNMLRVWGGGIYEHDVFYDLCDELGLMVWQDFMFACALYPGDDRFVASVRAEAEHQVRRLRHRACLALWCGNNEVEWGWFSWNWKNQFPASVWTDYQRIFDDLLPEICRRLDPARLYWPSSPASEPVSTGQPNDYGRGDVHYWEVWGDPKATPSFYERQRPRFASEFGFQSFPEPRTVAAYARPDERAPDSAVMLMHQKAPQGNEKIRGQVARMFGAPRDDDSFFWLSQLVQAEYVRVGVEHFRRLQPHCRGALFWQINDCWPVASWASIDYFGRWKALHYAARRFFAPLLLSLRRDEAGLAIVLVSDQAEPAGGRLTVRLLDVEGAVRKTWRRGVTPRGAGAHDVWSLPPDGLAGLDCAHTVLAAEFKDGRRLLARASWLLAEAVEVALPDPGLSVRMVARGSRVEALVTVRSYAHAVLLEADGAEGRFDDNFFPLLPGESRRVRFRPRARGARPAHVRARSLVDLLTAPGGVAP